jgi:hypothetical protein
MVYNATPTHLKLPLFSRTPSQSTHVLCRYFVDVCRRFPYAILEVKLQDKNAAPAWVHELKTSGVLVEAPRFSKFLHGMALLQPTTIHEVPAWFAWREGDRINLPASLDEMWDMTAERRAQKEMDWQVRGGAVRCLGHWAGAGAGALEANDLPHR